MIPVLLSLVDEPRWVDEHRFELGSAEVMLDDGLAFEVIDSVGARVGFAFVGSATFAWTFAERGEALAFVTTMAGPGLEEPADTLRPTLQTLRWQEPTDLLLVLGEDVPMQVAVEGWPIVRREKGLLGFTNADGEDEVIVADATLQEALWTAKTALERRSQRLAAVGLDPVVMIEQAARREGTSRLIVEARTSRVWVPVLGAYLPGACRPLGHLGARPDRGVDDAYTDVVAVHSIGEDKSPRWRVLTGTPFAEGAAAQRAYIQDAVANVTLEPVEGWWRSKSNGRILASPRVGLSHAAGGPRISAARPAFRAP